MIGNNRSARRLTPIPGTGCPLPEQHAFPMADKVNDFA
jgi:hypothetical protein